MRLGAIARARSLGPAVLRVLPGLMLGLMLELMPGIPAHAGPAPVSRSLCGAGESTYFACHADGGPRIALCGRLPERLQLRVARPHMQPLALPADAAEGPTRLKYAHYSRFHVDHVQVAFEDSVNRYTLFDRSEDGARQWGLETSTLATGTETRTLCSGTPVGALRKLKSLLACDSDSALNGDDCK